MIIINPTCLPDFLECILLSSIDDLLEHKVARMQDFKGSWKLRTNQDNYCLIHAKKEKLLKLSKISKLHTNVIMGRQPLSPKSYFATFHQHFLEMFLKGSRLVGKVKSVRFLTSDVAIIHAVGGTMMDGQTDLEPDRNSVQTLVAVKRDTK